MVSLVKRSYRALRRFLHPLRARYVTVKWWGRRRFLQIDLLVRERRGKTVAAATPSGEVRLVPRGSTVMGLLMNGDYEPDTMAFLTRNVENGHAFLDVGANAGLFSLAVARACPQSRVYAFEPTKQTFDLLKKNILLNGLANVYPVNVALSDQDGEAALNINTTDRDGLNTLLPPVHSFAKVIGTETVRTMKLDSFLKHEHVGPIGLIKIDVEGAEALVLQGASSLLSQDPAPLILFECWEGRCEVALRLLTDHGYVVSDASHDMKLAVKPASVVCRASA